MVLFKKKHTWMDLVALNKSFGRPFAVESIFIYSKLRLQGLSAEFVKPT